MISQHNKIRWCVDVCCNGLLTAFWMSMAP